MLREMRVSALSSKCFPPPTAPRVIARHKTPKGLPIRSQLLVNRFVGQVTDQRLQVCLDDLCLPQSVRIYSPRVSLTKRKNKMNGDGRRYGVREGRSRHSVASG